MLMFIRHLIAVAVLPFTVAVLIPLWIARQKGIAFGIGASAFAVATQLVGALDLAVAFCSLAPRRGIVRYEAAGRSHPGTRRGRSSSTVRIATCAIP
jgi:hypothetical protein